MSAQNPNKISFVQENFGGGINQMVDTTRIGRNEFPLLINGRNRYDIIEPIQLPLDITDSSFPAGGIIQGVYSAGDVLIVFVGGLAFYKYFERPDSNFQQIEGFSLSSTAPIIYAEAVPISYNNYTRIPDTRTESFNVDVLLSTITTASPQGLVCQDGINQPQFINSNFKARDLGNYASWSLVDREYVPIGRQMMYHNGILYIISPDGRRIYRSVTGRPTDFMVIVQPITGEKYATEEEGGAAAVAHTVDYDVITCINRLNTDDGSFFVSTHKLSYAVTPLLDDADLIIGEPTFQNRTLFSVGSVSPFCFVEMLGDYAFADFNGLRSFNAILNAKNEGKNTPFSKKLGRILQGIQQDYVAATTFDNYALFAVNTIYGRGIVFYDTLTDIFSSVDYYPNIGQIKQFAELKTTSGRYLFFSTVDNKVYQAFASPTTAQTQIYVGDWCSNDPEKEHHISNLRLVLIDSEEDGTIYAQPYVDGRAGQYQAKEIVANVTNESTEIPPPFGDSTKDRVQIVSFDFGRQFKGWKAGFFLTWNFKTKLSHVGLITDMTKDINTTESAARSYTTLRQRLG